MRDGITLLCTDFPYYKLHKYLVKSQLEHVNFIKEKQPEDHALIIMDYSENYSTVSSNEIQSAYFAKRQISIFTAIAYVGQNEPITFLIGNDDINHAKDQVWLYQKKILSSLVVAPDNLRIVLPCQTCYTQMKISVFPGAGTSTPLRTEKVLPMVSAELSRDQCTTEL